MTQPTSAPRPAIVNIAFWLVVAGAALLLAGGLLGLTSAFGTNQSEDSVRNLRVLLGGMSVLWVAAGMALSFFAGRARNGDLRFRRTVVAMAVAVVVLVFLLTLLAPFVIAYTEPVMFGIVPVAIGATLFMRPAASDWFLEVR